RLLQDLEAQRHLRARRTALARSKPGRAAEPNSPDAGREPGLDIFLLMFFSVLSVSPCLDSFQLEVDHFAATMRMRSVMRRNGSLLCGPPVTLSKFVPSATASFSRRADG